MKFQNPSFNFFLNGCTNKRTDKPKAICSPLFQSWGIITVGFLWLSLPVHSGLLKKTDYLKQICLAHPVSFECSHCS